MVDRQRELAEAKFEIFVAKQRAKLNITIVKMQQQALYDAMIQSRIDDRSKTIDKILYK